jgi:putative heme-binding domain-containing protein
MLTMLARRLSGEWNAASTRPQVVQIIDRTLADPEMRRQGIALATSTRDGRYRETLKNLAEDSKAPDEERVAAVEGLGSLKGNPDQTLDRLIESVRGKPSSNPVAEAAVRTIARIKNERTRLVALLTAADYPLGLRREALRTLARVRDGSAQILKMAGADELPADLKNDATTLLHTDPERRIRDQATRLLPLPKTAGGQPLPPIGELIRRRGDAEKGRLVFFRSGTNSCAGCHRVQGRGQWIGPDLSTIGVKYGRDELIRSILSPSDSIGVSYRSLVAALADGRVITGLPVEDTPERLVIKTADGQRISVEPRSVENRRSSDISLMPEGLAQTMTTQEVVDLLSYLTTLRRGVSIVGEYHAIGPIYEPNGARLIDPASAPELHTQIADGRGHQLSWRRLGANAEGQVDLTLLASGDPKDAAYALVPVTSAKGQSAQLVIDTPAEVSAWFNGKVVAFTGESQEKGEPRTAQVDLPPGSSKLLLRLTVDGRPDAREIGRAHV